MQAFVLAAVITAQMVGSLFPTTPITTSYFDACRKAQTSGSALVILIEDSSSPQQRSIDLTSIPNARANGSMPVCRIDVGTDFGARLAESFGASDLPYAVVTDPDGDIVYRGSGPFVVPNPVVTATLRTATVPSGLSIESESDRVFAESDFEDAMRRAKKAERLLVVFVSTDSCFYCVKMEQESLADDSVQAAVAKQFVSATVKASECQNLVAEHGIRMYPTTLVLTSQGSLVDRIEGYVPAGQLLSRLERATSNLVSQR